MQNQKVFFTSDIHFNHASIINYCEGRGSSVEEMNEKLISNINSKVGPNDKLYIIGDVAMGQIHLAPEYIRRVNGEKILVAGNHDKTLKKLIKNNPEHQDLFQEIHSIYNLSYRHEDKKYNFVLCHFPLLDWENQENGFIHLHGHKHSTSDKRFIDEYRRMDIGLDGNNLFPYSIEEIIEIMKDRPYKGSHHE